MTCKSTTARCLVLAAAAALSMPMLTDASHIRGGDTPDCDYVKLGDTDCAPKTDIEEGACDKQKKQCDGCGTGEKGKKCKTIDKDCGDSDCIGPAPVPNPHNIDGQEEGSEDPGACISSSC